MLKFLVIFCFSNLVFAQSTKYEAAINRLKATAAANAANAQLFTMGTNDQGQPIQGLKIGNGATKALVVGTHHGNEYGSTEVALGFAAYLAKAPIKDLTVFVIPVLNISGYNAGIRYERNLTKELVDSNRDYTGPCKVGPSYKLKSTLALTQFLVSQNIAISATLHTFSPVVVYPWGISTHDLSTPYDAQYKKLVAAATVESRYKTGNNTEMLYAADGTFEDYAFWKHGIWSLLFELGTTHNPSQQSVANMVAVNNPGIKRFLEQAPRARATQFAFTGRCDYSKSRQRVFLE